MTDYKEGFHFHCGAGRTMPYAISLIFSPDDEAQIQSFSKRLDPTWASIGFRPHLALAVLDEMDEAVIRALMEDLARSTPSFSVEFTHPGVFPTEKNEVFLAVAHTNFLHQLHRNFIEKILERGMTVIELSRPDHWVPHCTFGIHLSEEKRSQAIRDALQTHFFSKEMRIAGIDLIKFRPARNICEFPFH